MTNGPYIQIDVEIGPKAQDATIVIPALQDPGVVGCAQCLARLERYGIQITPGVERRVSEIVEAMRPGVPTREIVAEATRPIHGGRGSILWHVGPDAEDREGAHPVPGPEGGEAGEPGADDEPERIDHHARSNYTMVTARQELGRIIPPSEPIDGSDVQGRVIAAKPGRPATLRYDEESIEVTPEGLILAGRDGVLSRSRGRWAVRQHIQIPGSVDFSTGNIDFVGDIEVLRDVRDCFVVRTGGNLEVLGVIEAAELRVAGDLYARGGIASRERGHITALGDLVAKYADGARLDVGGALRVKREIMNCHTVVHGDVESPSATLMGGVLVGAGRIRLATTGGPGGVRTRLVLGSVPRLEAKLAQSARLVTTLRERAAQLPEGAPERALATARVSELEEAHAQLQGLVEAAKTVDVWVSLEIHAGTQFVLESRVFQVRQTMSGPVSIRWARDAGLMYRVGREGEFRPLIEKCDADVRTAA